MDKIDLTADRLRELLHYDPDTGDFTCLVSGGRAKKGNRVGTVHGTGYVQIQINRKQYLGHRLAWLYVHGVWPESNIDHIDGFRANNRIKNLRDVKHCVNMQNKKYAQRNSKTGFLGVLAHKGKFKARIGIDGKLKELGTYATPEKAHEAYLAAKRERHEGCTI